jgi:zinc/manganese transport system permease protein
VSGVWGAIFQPGFFTSDEVRTALIVGGVVAVVSGVVGVFTVLRGQSFAGHALTDIGATGGSGAYLLAVPPLWGFLALSVVGAGVMELIGIHRARGRDLATGVVLGAALGLAALFLYWDTTWHSSNGQAMNVLFGSIFALSTATIPLVAVFSALSLTGVAVVFRPLLLCGLHPDLARAQRVRVRLVGWVYLGALAIAVALTSIAIGSILSTALLIGPAATAVRLTRRPGMAMVWAAAFGVVAMWLGVLLSYDSYTWPPTHHGWPVSFLVVALIVVGYLFADVAGAGRRNRRREPRRLPARCGDHAGDAIGFEAVG